MSLLSLTLQNNFSLIPRVERPVEIQKEIPRRENAVSYETIHKMIANCRAFDRNRSESLGNYVDVYA